jgi:RNA polymerase sigma-70 factor (ECF subfamily)
VAGQIYIVNQTTSFSLPIFPAGDGAPDSPGAGEKIIQRIPRPEWSDWLKASRMADADSELVLRSQQADPAAFEELVRQHQRMIHALTFRMTGSLADAEDLAQETFLRAYQQIGSFRGASKFSTWLYRIAMNICLNWRQSETRRCHLYAQAAGEFSTQHADQGNFPADQAAEVQAALLKLPAKQRAAIVLTIYDGLNHAEAAHVLSCSETTVSWRVFAARRKLKRLLTAGRSAPLPPPAGEKTCAEDRTPSP